MAYVAGVPYDVEEINLIEGSGCTVAEVRAMHEQFPDLELDACIGNVKMEQAKLEKPSEAPAQE